HVGTGSTETTFPLRLVFVTDRNRKDTYLVLATTALDLRPNEVVALYQRRWSIEGYFKAAKQYLRLTQTKIQDYDGLCGHTAMVILTYDILVWQRRLGMNRETLGDVFNRLQAAAPKITLLVVLAGLARALQPLCDQYGMPEAELNNAINDYLASVPRMLEIMPDLGTSS
ncbi:IS4 family transposase, partial [Schleiferilactobacillus harbinensis]|uniref:transposase n=1 Tax=Schleiferilactobacillus harbinensis TaxID=304207 RepID=UPI0021A39206